MRRIGQQTLLFVDEIHRFNRAQQDGFLPYVEDGTVVLVGATTENPSFELNAALLVARQVLILNRLDAAALGKLLDRAEALEGRPLPLTAGGARGAGRHRRRRRPLPAQPGRDPVLDRARRAARAGRARRAAPPPGRGLRQGPRGPLQPHLGAAQSDPRLRPAGGALLSRADADRGRGAALSAAPPDPRRRRGYRPRRPAGAGPVPRRQGRLRFPRLARGRARDRPGLPLSRHRAQIERRLQGAEGAPGAARRRPAR